MSELIETIAEALRVGSPLEDDTHDYRPEAQTALAAIKVQGLVVVPIVPTRAMLVAGIKAEEEGECYYDGPDIWAAMLAASPFSEVTGDD